MKLEVGKKYKRTLNGGEIFTVISIDESKSATDDTAVAASCVDQYNYTFVTTFTLDGKYTNHSNDKPSEYDLSECIIEDELEEDPNTPITVNAVQVEEDQIYAGSFEEIPGVMVPIEVTTDERVIQQVKEEWLSPDIEFRTGSVVKVNKGESIVAGAMLADGNIAAVIKKPELKSLDNLVSDVNTKNSSFTSTSTTNEIASDFSIMENVVVQLNKLKEKPRRATLAYINAYYK